MATDSNVNLNQFVNSGNTGFIKNYKEPGIPVAIVLVPKGTVIPPNAMTSTSAFSAYVDLKFKADVRSGRWFAFTKLDKFNDETLKASIEDTGIYQLRVFQFATKWTFRYMQGMGNFIEALNFDGSENDYDTFSIDSSGTWGGTVDPAGTGGLKAYTSMQIAVNNLIRRDTKTANQYMLSMQYANPVEFNNAYAQYVAGYDPSSIAMLENVVLTNVSTTLGTPLGVLYDATTDVVIIGKMGQGSTDFVQMYETVLTKACFTARDLTSSTALTISDIVTGSIVVTNQAYYYVVVTLSAAPTATHKVQISLAAPSVVNGIIAGADVVCEIVQLGVDSQNAAVKTF